MKIAILKERRSGETRVAGTPDTVKKYVGLGLEVSVEKGAGSAAAYSDQAYEEAGAKLSTTAALLKEADILLSINGLDVSKDLKGLKKGAAILAQIGALNDKKTVDAYAKAGATLFDMQMVPRISRAQSMDVLSSQANLAGYKAVIEGANTFGRAFPMMMTAAGTIAPAKVFIMGVGVAGLQAIATAKRLGAVVTATDVRPATKEQVASLGGKFLEVDAEMEKDAQTEGGYAKEMPPEYFEKQKQVVAEHIKKQDVVITTALIPGRPAPVLVTEEMVQSMAEGSVIVDLAAPAGGNCPLTELDKVVVKHGVTLVGHGNLAGLLPVDASNLFAKNLFNFLSPMVDKENKTVVFDWDDEIIKGSLVTKDGEIVNSTVAAAGEG